MMADTNLEEERIMAEVRGQGDKTDSSGCVGVATHKDGTEK